MNFERGKDKDPKETIGIGIEVFLIKKISEKLADIDNYKDYELTTESLPNNPEIKASWNQPLTGYYFQLIKDTKNRLFLEDSDYSYYLEYDHGLHYGNMLVDDFIN